MGNLYNVEQKYNPTKTVGIEDVSQAGLAKWKQEVRKQIMEKLKGYSPEHVDDIIKKTFSDSYYS
jgi:hypothetical protein